jgi:hypothetical protein
VPAVPEPAPETPLFHDHTFGTCTLTRGDFVHAIEHEPRTRALLRWATGIGVLTLGWGVWLLSGRETLAGAIACVFGISCFIAHQAPEHAAARWFDKTPPRARLLKITLNPAALLVVSELSHNAYPWRSLDGYHEAPDSFLVWVSSKTFLILPKRAFAAEDLPKVVARFELEVGAPPRLPPYWGWLFGAIVLVLGLLWAWNRLDPR